MKKWLIISLVFNLLIIAAIAFIAMSWQGYVRSFSQEFIKIRYDQKTTMFEAMPVQDSAIIFLGNSITEGANWDELFEQPNIINRGIGGDVTAGVIRRLPEVIRHQPSKLFIAIGTNDISIKIPTAEIIENYKTIIQKVQEGSPRTQIYVQSLLPVSVQPGSLFGHNNEQILEVNEELKKLSEEMKLPYLDLHPHFLNDEGELKGNLSNDDLHLLGEGYEIWRDLIKEYVSE